MRVDGGAFPETGQQNQLEVGVQLEPSVRKWEVELEGSERISDPDAVRKRL